MAYTAVVRAELQFTYGAWNASYRLHFGYARPVTLDDVKRVAAWAAQFDIPNFYIGNTIGSIRTAYSKFVRCRATELRPGGGFTHLLLIDNAVQDGGDSELPVLSAEQAIQLELATGKRGRGVNGRVYLPYWGNAAYSQNATDHMNPDAVTFVQGVASSFGFWTPTAIGAEWCVLKRQVAGIPVSPLLSDKVTGTAIRSTVFRSQRRRVQAQRPFLPVG